MTPEEEHIPFDRTDPNPFGLPAGYFQQSARSVFDKIEWLEEHKEFPVLASLQDKQAFAVPASYFEHREELLHYPALMALKKQQPFAVPDGYFEAQEVNELAKVMNAEENTFAFIPKQNSFSVPAAYFAEKELQLQQVSAIQARPARIIFLFGPKARLAVAAMLVAALGLWIYQANSPVEELKDCGTIACIDKIDLLKSKSLESLETDELYDLVNSKDLEKKMQNKETKSADKSHDSLDESLIDELPDEI